MDDDIIGIDLGTTNSQVVIWRNNNYEIITDENGNNSIPSIVAFTNISRYIGDDAKNQTELNPKNVFYEVKRLIGRKIDDESVINDREFLTYDIVGDKDGNILLQGDYKQYTPEEISSMILSKLKIMACNYLGKDITKAIITVPAYFNDSQRQATKDASLIAGLDCIRIINEPTAAALAYGFYNRSLQQEDKDINIMVYDYGGGTLDVSVLNITNGLFEVLGSVGNTHLGGTDFDTRIMQYCLKSFKTKYGIDKINNIQTLSIQKLKKACENAKKILSTSQKTIIAIKDFYDSKDLLITITQNKFIELCNDLLLISIKPIEEVLESCNLEKNDIDEIILVGGMTRVPIIRENIKNFFNGKEPNSTINPEEAVAIGASIQGYKLSHDDDPFSGSMTLLDITSLSLGIETYGGIMDILIDRNTIIPVSKSKMYTTDTDFETTVLIKVFEGERKLTKDNFLVGEFELKGIESLPRGLAKIEVTFSIDVNGIITVKAKDHNTNSSNSIIITGNKGRLKPEEINKLIQNAKEYELKDKIEKYKKQYYYEIDDLCNNIRYNLLHETLKLNEEDKKNINDEINKIEKWLKDISFLEHTEDEYQEIIDKLKKNYGLLIFRTTYDTNNIKSNNVGINGTSIYNDNDDDEVNLNTYEKIDDDELGDDKDEIKHLRESLKELCNNIFDILGSKTLQIDESNIVKLREYIDDVLLWIHVHDKATKNDYKMKIDLINEQCDEIVNNHRDLFISSDKSRRKELEELCYYIKSSIDTKMFILNDKQLMKLDNKIIETLEWLINTEDNNTTIYDNKIEEINELCNSLYQENLLI